MNQLACELYRQNTGNNHDYKGESVGVMMLRGVDVELITKRNDPDQVTKDTLKEKQCNRCSVCYEELEEGRDEVCHIIPRVSSSGDEGNSLSNLTLKCKPCHNDENTAQYLANQNHSFHTIASHPSPFLHRVFLRCGKPLQQVSGLGAENIPMGLSVFEADARGSRPNGIFDYAYRLPIFSPIDDPQPCTWSDGTWRRPITDYDYVFVDCDNRYDLTEQEERHSYAARGS